MAGLPLSLQWLGVDPFQQIRRLGRLPTTADQRARKVKFADLAPCLAPAPDACDWSGPNLTPQILLNDQLGDCGPAAMMEGIKSWAAQHGQNVMVSDADVVKFYGQAGGYVPGRPWTDGGVNNPTMLSAAQKAGIVVAGMTHKIGPTATVSNTDVELVKKAIFYLGGALFGINLSRKCYADYGPGHLWDADSSGSEGAHDVWGYGYNPQGPTILTWSQKTQCTWAWCAKFAEDIDVIETDDGDTITACGAPVARLHYERV